SIRTEITGLDPVGRFSSVRKLTLHEAVKELYLSKVFTIAVCLILSACSENAPSQLAPLLESVKSRHADATEQFAVALNEYAQEAERRASEITAIVGDGQAKEL